MNIIQCGYANYNGLISLVCRDEQILAKCGLDAVQYLSFQKNIILLVGIITLISLGVVLPINYNGDLQQGEHTFGRTTIANLHPQ